ncbi:hypothetical protein ENHYD8BJ_30007 [Enhydrobacter sp. 8BJ]|nr:hypothetical protein ENHYD8BJ_30007 [Enhydrobacter sp. 8BJ]
MAKAALVMTAFIVTPLKLFEIVVKLLDMSVLMFKGWSTLKVNKRCGNDSHDSVR